MKGSNFNSFMKLFMVLLLAGFIGCAASDDQMKTDEASLQRPIQNPVEIVSQLGPEIAAAKANGLDVLSPAWLPRAEQAYQEAQNGLESGEEISSILDSVTRAKTALTKARENAEIARTTLGPVIKGRETARQAGAVQLGEDYNAVEANFLSLTRAIEDNDLRYAQNNAEKVRQQFNALEIRAIKVDTIGKVRELFKAAELANAKKIAPQTYAETKKMIEDVDVFISANPYAKDKMRQMAQKALFQVNRLNAIIEQSEKAKTMQLEQVALWVEELMQRISASLLIPDMRDQRLEAQTSNVLETIQELRKDRQDQSDRVASLNKRLALLEGRTIEEQTAMERLETERRETKELLEAERRFNQLFVEVQNYFDSDEAEVYKQGRHLVTRLKGIRFPVGSNIILPDNYALLSKVQRAIQTFGEPEVIIEGHTDSTGTDKINEYLSMKRAEAVREYLTANKTLPPEKIAAIGYGPARPVATNQTPEGRAMNRRIDIIITPPENTGK